MRAAMRATPAAAPPRVADVRARTRAAGAMRLLVVRDAKPVRELRVRPRTVGRVVVFGLLALWCAPLAVLAGIAKQARDDRELLAGDVRTLTQRTARLSSHVAALEKAAGVTAVPADSTHADSVPRATDTALASAVERSGETDTWLGDLERRIRTVRGAIQLRAVRGAIHQGMLRLRAIPSGFPVPGRFSSGFGWRANPFTGRGAEYHKGLDIPSPYGAPVRATADGVVEYAERRSGYGLAVAIRHDDGFSTLFGHLSAATVHAGQRVTRDAVVGRVGNEGRSTGPHVHYEVRRWGTPVDPRRVHVSPRPPAAPLLSNR